MLEGIDTNSRYLIVKISDMHNAYGAADAPQASASFAASSGVKPS